MRCSKPYLYCPRTLLLEFDELPVAEDRRYCVFNVPFGPSDSAVQTFLTGSIRTWAGFTCHEMASALAICGHGLPVSSSASTASLYGT